MVGTPEYVAGTPEFTPEWSRVGGVEIVSGVKGSRFGREDGGEEWGMEEIDSDVGDWCEVLE